METAQTEQNSKSLIHQRGQKKKRNKQNTMPIIPGHPLPPDLTNQPPLGK
jgi:hypothetical protein